MTDQSTAYPRLRYFFSAYFTNFWVDMYADWQGVVRDFCRSETRPIVDEARTELARLLNNPAVHGDLKRLVTRELGANIRPKGFGMTWEQWLREMQAILDKGGN